MILSPMPAAHAETALVPEVVQVIQPPEGEGSIYFRTAGDVMAIVRFDSDQSDIHYRWPDGGWRHVKRLDGRVSILQPSVALLTNGKLIGRDQGGLDNWGLLREIPDDPNLPGRTLGEEFLLRYSNSGVWGGGPWVLHDRNAGGEDMWGEVEDEQLSGWQDWQEFRGSHASGEWLHTDTLLVRRYSGGGTLEPRGNHGLDYNRIWDYRDHKKGNIAEDTVSVFHNRGATFWSYDDQADAWNHLADVLVPVGDSPRNSDLPHSSHFYLLGGRVYDLQDGGKPLFPVDAVLRGVPEGYNTTTVINAPVIDQIATVIFNPETGNTAVAMIEPSVNQLPEAEEGLTLRLQVPEHALGLEDAPELKVKTLLEQVSGKIRDPDGDPLGLALEHPSNGFLVQVPIGSQTSWLHFGAQARILGPEDSIQLNYYRDFGSGIEDAQFSTIEVGSMPVYLWDGQYRGGQVPPDEFAPATGRTPLTLEIEVILENDPPEITIAGGVPLENGETLVIPESSHGLLYVDDIDTAASDLEVSWTVSNPSIIPEGSIFFTAYDNSNRFKGNGTLLFTAPDEIFEASDVSLTVVDGEHTLHYEFRIVIEDADDPPRVYLPVPDRIVFQGEEFGIPLTVYDHERVDDSSLMGIGPPLRWAELEGGGFEIMGASADRGLRGRAVVSNASAATSKGFGFTVREPWSDPPDHVPPTRVLVSSKGFTLTIVNPGAVFAHRFQPSIFLPGQRVPVAIEVDPPAGGTVHNVEETVPAGWTVENITDGGFHDPSANRVRWGPFFDAAPRTLRFDLLPPVDIEIDFFNFEGRSSADGVDAFIGGPNLLLRGATHPADLGPEDAVLDIDEVTAYGSAWKTGAGWSRWPDPVQLDYVTRAGFLWKNGESYLYNPTKWQQPLIWENLPPEIHRPGAKSMAAPSRKKWKGPSTKDHHGNGEAVSTISGNGPVEVLLKVTPRPDARVYAVEDRIPQGWTASDLDNGGSIDRANHKVKWGPYFDNSERTFSYRVQPPPGEEAEGLFSGVASFDGESVLIGGDRSVGGAVVDPPGGESFEEWLTRILGPLAASPRFGSADSDISGDGISNLMNFFMGTDPLENNASFLPRLRRAGDGGLRFRFRRSRAIGGVGGEVEFSQEFQDWTALPAPPVTVESTADYDLLEVEVPEASWASFLRLRVTIP